MGEIIELKPKAKEPEVKEEVAADWGAVEALNGCLEDIKTGAIAMPTHLYIAMLVPGEDGEDKMAFVQSGMENCFETIGVLEIHKVYHSGQWREVDGT